MSKAWHAALYMRLSKEDERRGESLSIENQRKLLLSFCQKHGFQAWKEYVDDGFSGTDMETRPALQEMLADIRAKRVNLVLTKDLSRLGRNIGDTANLLDKFFPQHRVRFISVTDGTDSEKRDRTQRILTPLHNFTNELYAADISDKIYAALQTKIQNGEYIGSFAPYGYEKDAACKNYLVPDAEAAEVVKQIFSFAAAGTSPGEIAEILNKKRVLTPSQYRTKKYPTAAAFPKAVRWTSGSVGKLLRNEIYLGHTLQGKTEKPSFKCKVSHSVPRENWIVVRDTHEALVDEETWRMVRKRMGERRRTGKTGFQNQLSGIAVCADCGRNMSTAFSHGKACLVCGGYKAGGWEKCESHRIDYETLLSAVKAAISEAVGVPSDVFSHVERITVEAEKEGQQHVHVFLR